MSFFKSQEFSGHTSIVLFFIDLPTVKPVLSDHSKIGKIKVLKTGRNLLQVQSIAECSIAAFCNTFDLH